MHRVLSRISLIGIWIHWWGWCVLPVPLIPQTLIYLPSKVSPKGMLNQILVYHDSHLYTDIHRVDMWGVTWVWMGTMSAIAQSVVTITSVKWLRKKWYEFFFLCHVIFVL